MRCSPLLFLILVGFISVTNGDDAPLSIADQLSQITRKADSVTVEHLSGDQPAEFTFQDKQWILRLAALLEKTTYDKREHCWCISPFGSPVPNFACAGRAPKANRDTSPLTLGKIHPMLPSFSIAALLVAISATTYASRAEEDKPVVASVVDSRRLPLEANVAVELLVENPPEFAGARFYLIAGSREQAAVDASFPAGTRLAITLPTSLVWELEEQRRVQKAIQLQLDAGIQPERISKALSGIPFVRISNLLAPPSFILLQR